MSGVERRDVFFFPGYDIAGVGRYHRHLQRQCGWYARRFDVSFEVSPLTASSIEHWKVAEVVARWPGAHVITRVHFCDWRADIAKDYTPPLVVRAKRAWRAWWRMTRNGQTRRIARAAPQFALVFAAPLMLMILRGLAVAGALWAITLGGVIAAIGSVMAILALYGFWRLSDLIYESFLGNYITFLDRQLYGPKNGAAPDTLTSAIGTLCAHSRPDNSDELLIAGHSFGAVAAMKAAAQLSAAGSEVSLLTAGSNIACLALDKNEGELRAAITSLYETEAAVWRDYYAPQDSLSFSQVEPIRDFHLATEMPPKADVKIRSAVYDAFVSKRKIRKFRWNVFRMHFQFMMAADTQTAYDWHRFLLGPNRLRDAAR